MTPYSDSRLKTNVQTITGALATVAALRGVTFQPSELALVFGFEPGEQLGVIAQEMQSVVPSVVHPAPFDIAGKPPVSLSGDNYLTVDYARLVPLLIAAINELSVKVTALGTT